MGITWTQPSTLPVLCAPVSASTPAHPTKVGFLAVRGAALRTTRFQGADLDLAVFMDRAAEPADAVDVDQQRRRRQAHVEGRNQALAAGEQAGVFLAEQRDGLFGRVRAPIGEWRRLQVVVLPNIFSHCDWERGQVNV